MMIKKNKLLVVPFPTPIIHRETYALLQEEEIERDSDKPNFPGILSSELLNKMIQYVIEELKAQQSNFQDYAFFVSGITGEGESISLEIWKDLVQQSYHLLKGHLNANTISKLFIGILFEKDSKPDIEKIAAAISLAEKMLRQKEKINLVFQYELADWLLIQIPIIKKSFSISFILGENEVNISDIEVAQKVTQFTSKGCSIKTLKDARRLPLTADSNIGNLKAILPDILVLEGWEDRYSETFDKCDGGNFPLALIEPKYISDFTLLDDEYAVNDKTPIIKNLLDKYASVNSKKWRFRLKDYFFKRPDKNKILYDTNDYHKAWDLFFEDYSAEKPNNIHVQCFDLNHPKQSIVKSFFSDLLSFQTKYFKFNFALEAPAGTSQVQRSQFLFIPVYFEIKDITHSDEGEAELFEIKETNEAISAFDEFNSNYSIEQKVLKTSEYFGKGGVFISASEPRELDYFSAQYKKEGYKLSQFEYSYNSEDQLDNLHIKVYYLVNQNLSHSIPDFVFKNLFQIGVFTKRNKEATNVVELQATKAAETKIISRNFSHHIGSHVMPYVSLKQIKERFKQLMGVDIDENYLDILKNRLDTYITERNEFLCDPSNQMKSVLFCAQIIAPFLENVLVMDNLCKSEGLEYQPGGGCDIEIYVTLNGKDIKINYDEKVYPHVQYGDFFKVKPNGNKETVSAQIHDDDVPIAISNTHIIFSILENFIRNTAKHQKQQFRPNGGCEDKLKVTVELKSDENDPHSYWLNISDNVSVVDEKFPSKAAAKIINDNYEVAQSDLGIIDFKICAGLLNSIAFNAVNEDVFKIDRSTLGKLSYSFRILKPKDVCLIGYPIAISESYPTFTFHNNSAEFLKASRSKVPYQFFVIKEKELERLLIEESNANLLPFRTLVEKERKNQGKEIFWNQEKFGKKYLLISSTPLIGSKEQTIESCYAHWLMRWGVCKEHKAELVVYSDTELPGWKNAKKDNDIFELNYGFSKSLQANEDRLIIKSISADYPKVFFDHHGGGLGSIDLEEGKSFLSRNAYVAFGKNSKDFATIHNCKPSNRWILPYNLIEAGVSNILIIDERILDLASKQSGNVGLSKTLTTKGKFWYSKYTDKFSKWDAVNQKIHNIDSFWAANFTIATHLNSKPLKSGLFSENDSHFVKLKFDEKAPVVESNFDFLSSNDSKVDDFKNNERKQFDAVVVHRTFLNKESISTYWKDFKEAEDIIKLLNKHFPAVFITSGGGDVLTYDGNYKFISFNELLQALINPEAIGKTTLVNNLFTK